MNTTQPTDNNNTNLQTSLRREVQQKHNQKEKGTTVRPTKLTKAFEAIIEYRELRNAGRISILCSALSSQVFMYGKEGRFGLIGYKGRAKKCAFSYIYRTQEARQAKIQKWMEECLESKKRREPTKRELVVGDVLKASWGYEQTNIDYYLVTGLVGKSSVTIVEIGQSVLEGKQSMTGTCMPNPEIIKGEPMTKRVDGKGVKICDFIWASRLAYKTVAKVRLYEISSWSSYH